MVLESVAAGYAARHLIWKYIIEGLLRDEGLSPEQIMQRLDEERRTWNAERDQAADLLEQAIRELGSNRESGSG
jgi:DNA-binding transcriptional MerR regulator